MTTSSAAQHRHVTTCRLLALSNCTALLDLTTATQPSLQNRQDRATRFEFGDSTTHNPSQIGRGISHAKMHPWCQRCGVCCWSSSWSVHPTLHSETAHFTKYRNFWTPTASPYTKQRCTFDTIFQQISTGWPAPGSPWSPGSHWSPAPWSPSSPAPWSPGSPWSVRRVTPAWPRTQIWPMF